MNLWIRNFRQRSVGMAYPTSLSVDWGGRLGMKVSRWPHPHFWDRASPPSVWSLFTWSFIFSCLAWVSLHEKRILKQQNQKFQDLWRYRFIITLGHFHHILLVKQVMDSRRKEIDFTPWWQEWFGHIARSYMKGGVVVAICETIQHKHGWMSF